MYVTKTGVRHAPSSRGGMGDDFGDLLDLMFSGNVGSASTADPNDNVNQTTTGTSTTADDFTSVAGVCKPRNFFSLNVARELQRQLNRVAQVKGFPKVGVDGAIGPSTLALFTKVQGISNGQLMGTPTSCMGVAPDVDILAPQVKSLADSLGAPATVADPISLAPPTILTKSGKILVPPDAGVTGAFAAMSTVQKLALLGMAGGLGYLLLTAPKKKKGSK